MEGLGDEGFFDSWLFVLGYCEKKMFLRQIRSNVVIKKKII